MICVFVGSFRPTADGREGGQFTQCRLLGQLSPAPDWRWVPVDMTDESMTKSSVVHRVMRGLGRIRHTLRVASAEKAEAALLFTSNYPFSLVEKGLIGLALRLAGVRVYFSYRSQLRKETSALRALPLKLCRMVASGHFVQTSMAFESLVSLGAAPSRIRLLRNIVAQEFWEVGSPVDPRGADERNQLRLVYAGWLERIKGVDVLLDALQLLTEHGVDWSLEVLGAGTQESALQSRAEALGIADRIAWRGWSDSAALRTRLHEADLLVLPSRSEGLPNVILEAFSAGVPALATRVGGVPELIEDGINGYLVGPDNVAEMLAALQNAARDRRQLRGMGAAGKAKVARDYGEEQARNAIISLFGN